jgi:cell division septation protein DedD
MASTMASEDTEITLGTGKLLGLFFLLAAVCGVFFAIGYSLGKSSGREQALNDQAAVNSVQTSASVDNPNKPSAGVPAKEQPGPQDDTAKPRDLTFYKSVQQNQPDAQLTPSSDRLPATTTKGPAATTAGVPAVAATSSTSEETRSSTTADSGAYMVQIAAVSRQEDAAALAGALKKKSYSVFVVTNPAGTDNLFHVQVGPFSSLADAETMKAKLTSEGYNPIVKR